MSETSTQDLEPDEELPGEELEDDDELSAQPDARGVLTDDRQLTLEDAEDLAARRGLSVVLLAGEVDSGKTTLLVSVWNRLVSRGELGEFSFAGSRTALGFERRAWRSRLESRGERSTTPRTRRPDSGFLHLRLASGGTLHEFLLSDVAGEVFTEVREGKSFDDQIPWLRRVNAVLVFVDGAAIAETARRSTALETARRLLGHLNASETRSPRLRVAVVLSKGDLVAGASADRWRTASADLLKRAQQLDQGAVVLQTAARPATGTAPTGLEEFGRWLIEPEVYAQSAVAELERPQRMAGRAR